MSKDRMKYIVSILMLLEASSSFASSPMDCTTEDYKKLGYIGNIENAVYGSVTTYSDILREWIEHQISEFEHVLKYSKNPKISKDEALDSLLDIVHSKHGPHSEINCMRALTGPNDLLRDFQDNDGHVRRRGFALFRGQELIGYFYYEMALA